MTENNVRPRRYGALVAGVLGVVALSLTAATTLGGFSAAVTSTSNGTTGTLVLKATAGGNTCYSTDGTSVPTSVITDTNSANCTAAGTTLDLLGKNLLPGAAATTQTITLTNVGSINSGSASVATSGCTIAVAPGATYHGTLATASCGRFTFFIHDDTNNVCVYPAGAGACATTGTLAGFATAAAGAGLALNVTNLKATTSNATTYTVSSGLTSVAGSDNPYQGLAAQVPITWTLNQ